MAEALERSHMGIIQTVALAPESKTNRILLTLNSTAGSDASIELWAVQNQASAFEKTFHIPLDVTVTALPAVTTAVS